MGEGVRRDIIVKIRAESDLTHIDRTISRLDDLEKRVERLNPRLRLRVTADTGAATQNLGALAGRADLAARAMGGQLHPSARRAGAALDEVGAAAGHAGDTLQSAAGKVLLWSLASGAIYGTVRAVRGGIDAFAEIEAATVRLERVGRGFGSTQEEIGAGARFVTAEILRQSVALGQSSAEAQEAAVVFARLGLSQRETAEATRVAMLAANVAGIGAADAAKFLASAISQFQLRASDLPDVLDKLNTLENTTRVRTEDLLNAISRGGAVFREAGGSLEEFAGITAVVAQTTGRSGAEIGNAFKTIASRLASVDVQGKVFEKTGIAIRGLEGDLLPIGELLGRLVVQFQNMSQAEQAELTTQIAGVRQRNILQASLDNYFKTQEQVIRQLTTAGSAEEENAKILELLDTKLKQLVASFEHLASTIGNSGLGRLLKEIVDAIRFVIDGLARLGVAGVLIVGAVAAYAAAVVLAATGTGLFSASLNALVAGFVRVNTSLAGMVTGFGAHATAAGVSTTANLALAGSNEAVAASAARAAAAQSAMAGASAAAATAQGAVAARTALILSALTAVKEAARAAARFLIPVAGAIGAGATVGLGIVHVARRVAGGAPSESPLEEGSLERRVADRLGSRTGEQENAIKAAKERAEGARTLAGILADIEAKETAGARVSEQNLRSRAEGLDFLAKSIRLTAEEQEKLRRGTLTSADANKIAAREEFERRFAIDETRHAFEVQRAHLEQQRADVDRRIGSNLQLERSGGILDRFLGGDRGNLETFEEANARLRGFRKGVEEELDKVAKARADFEARVKEQERQRVERQNFAGKEEASSLSEDLRDLRDRRVTLRSPFATDELKKVNLDIEETSRLLAGLRNQIERNPDANEGFLKQLEEDARRTERELGKLQAKAIAVRTTLFLKEREKLDTRFENRQSRFADIRAIGPDRDVRLAEGAFQREQDRVREAEENLQNLRRQRRQAADFDFQRTAPGSAEEAKVKERILRLDAEIIAEQKALEGSADRIAEAWQAVEVARERAAIERRDREFDSEVQFIRQVGDARARLASVEGPDETRSIRQARNLAAVEEQRLRARRANIAALEAEQAQAAGRGETGDPEFVERDLEIQRQKRALQEGEVELQQRLRGVGLEILETSIRITEERRRQIEQTRKEIAGMSDLELLRTRVLAGRIGRGDLGQVSQETFLGLDQETRRTLLRQGELFPGAKVAPELDLGLGPGAFQRQIPGLPTPADLQQLFQNLNIMAPAEFRGAIQNAVLQGQNITIQRADGGGGVPEAAAAVQATFNFSGLEVPMDRLVNLLGLEFESRMQALISSKIEAGERAVNRPAGYRPARTG